MLLSEESKYSGVVSQVRGAAVHLYACKVDHWGVTWSSSRILPQHSTHSPPSAISKLDEVNLIWHPSVPLKRDSSFSGCVKRWKGVLTQNHHLLIIFQQFSTIWMFSQRVVNILEKSTLICLHLLAFRQFYDDLCLVLNLIPLLSLTSPGRKMGLCFESSHPSVRLPPTCSKRLLATIGLMF